MPVVQLETTTCGLRNCGREFKNEAGLRIHIAKYLSKDVNHFELWRQIKRMDEEHAASIKNKTEMISSHLQTNSEVVDAISLSQSSSSMHPPSTSPLFHQSVSKLAMQQQESSHQPSMQPSSSSSNNEQSINNDNETIINKQSINNNKQSIINEQSMNNNDKSVINKQLFESSESSSASANVIKNESNQIECPRCNQCFVNPRAFQSHHISCDPVSHNLSRLRNQHMNDNQLSSSNNKNNNNDNSINLSATCDKWTSEFQRFLHNISNFNCDEFDSLFSSFVEFLHNANNLIPGPIHPSVKYYRWRKQNKNNDNNGNDNNKSQYRHSSNPERADARKRKKRNDKYQYELAQHLYSHCRRKSVNMVMNQKQRMKHCPIPLVEIESHFRSFLELSNNNVLDFYPSLSPHVDIEVTVDDVENAIKKINLDT